MLAIHGFRGHCSAEPEGTQQGRRRVKAPSRTSARILMSLSGGLPGSPRAESQSRLTTGGGNVVPVQDGQEAPTTPLCAGPLAGALRDPRAVSEVSLLQVLSLNSSVS